METQPAPKLEPPATLSRRRDRVVGLLIVSVAFCATLSISWWAKIEATPESSKPPPPPSPEGLAGFPHQVDPIQALEIARTKTPREQLRGFTADEVAKDGTLDVSKGARIRYVFQSPAGHGPQPARDESGPPRDHYCGKQTVHVQSAGVVTDPDVPAVRCPPTPVETLPDPRCGPREVWTYALAKGVPADALARVEYYRSQVGPAWRFAIPRTRHSFSLYGDCGRELTPQEATGSVR